MRSKSTTMRVADDRQRLGRFGEVAEKRIAPTIASAPAGRVGQLGQVRAEADDASRRGGEHDVLAGVVVDLDPGLRAGREAGRGQRQQRAPHGAAVFGLNVATR